MIAIKKIELYNVRQEEVRRNMTEKRFVAAFVLLAFAVICVMAVSAAGVRAGKASVPETGNPAGIEFTIDDIYKDETGTYVSGKCFRPDLTKTYYNFGDDLTFDGVYAKIAFVVFHNGEAVEMPTHALLLSNMDEQEIYGVCEYNAFVLPEYEEDLAREDAALIWRADGKEEIFLLKDQREKVGEEAEDEA